MKPKRSSLFLIAAATLVAASSASAADGTWTLLTSGNASGTWSTATNWSGSFIADGIDGTADFSTLNITATSTIALDTARTIGTLKFGDATTASNNWNLNTAGTGAITLTLATSAGTPTINVVNGTATIGTYAAATNVILAGTQGFTKTGTGTLVLASNNTNTYGGTTFISAGTLQVGASGAFGQVGSASTTIDISTGATFNHIQGATVSQFVQGTGNVVCGTSGLAAAGSTFTGLNTYTGSTTIIGTVMNANTLTNSLTSSSIGASDGTVATNLVITNGGTLAYNGTTVASTDRLFQIGSTAAGGTGTISNNAATATNTLAFTNTAAVTYGTNNQTRSVGLGGSNTGANTFAALIGNNGTGVVSLTKSGAGNWSLTNTNTFTGATSIQNGTLTVSSIGASGVSGNLGAGTTINIGTTTTAGVLKYTGTGESTNRAIVLAGQSGGATFDQSGASGNLAYTGAVTNTGTGSKTVTFQGSTAGTGSFSGNIIDNATTGSTTLTAAYAANATTITLASVDGLAAGQTITIAGLSTTIQSVNAGTKVVTLTAGTATGAAIGASISSTALTNLTSVTKSGTGTWTLSGANTYSGTTTVSAGTLNLANPNTLQNSTLNQTAGMLQFDSSVVSNAFTLGGLSGTSGIALQNNAGSPAAVALTVGNNNVSTAYSGALSGAGSLTKSGTGTLALSGTTANTNTGGIIVNNGILDLTGTVAGGVGKIRGAITVNTNGTLRLSANDATGYNTGSDRLGVIHLVDGGTLNINTTSNQTLGSAVINMTGGSITGIAGSNLDFYGGASAVNTLASATTSTISGTKISMRQINGLTFDVADGVASVDLRVSSVIATSLNGGPYTNNNMVKTNTGTMVLDGANTYTGTTTVSGGTLKFAKTASFYSDTVNATNSAKLTVNTGAIGAFNVGGAGEFSEANITTILGAGNGTVGFKTGAILGLDTTGGNFTYSANLANPTGSTSLGLTKIGTNTLTLSGTNTYSGNTTVGEGSLSLATASLVDASTVNIATGATLNLTHSSIDTIDKLFINGVQQVNGLYKSATAGGAGIVLASLTGTGKLQVGPTNTFGSRISNYDFTAFPGANLTAIGDADGDGISNLLEEIFGTAPNAATTGITPTAATASSLTFTHPVNAGLAADVTYSYQWSSDLAEWKGSGQSNTGGTKATITAGAPISGEVTVTTTISAGPATKLFVRIVANQAP